MSVNPFTKSNDRNVQILFMGNYFDQKSASAVVTCSFCKEDTAIWLGIAGRGCACGECALNASADENALQEFYRLGGIDRDKQTKS